MTIDEFVKTTINQLKIIVNFIIELPIKLLKLVPDEIKVIFILILFILALLVLRYLIINKDRILTELIQ